MLQQANSARPTFLDGKPKKLYIDGKWVEAISGKTFDSVNPSTGELLDPMALGEAADVDLAVAAARRAFEGPWSQFKPNERSNVLLKLAELIERQSDDLIRLDSTDMGTPIKFMGFMIEVIINNLRFAAAQALNIAGATVGNSQRGELFTYTAKEPVGVVGAIIPWNGPLFQAAWKIGPVLATGCTLVIKPAEQASYCALRIAELCTEAGVPDGVVNVVTGFGEAGAALAAHPDVDKVSFTGSTETGQHVIRAAAGNIKRLTMELGGKSPDIVFADCNMDLAVPTAAFAGFVNSGQACSAGTRLFVERSIYEEFTEKVAAFAKSLKVGGALDPETDMGPLITAEARERVSGFMESAHMEGARALSGGAALTDGDYAYGFFVPPTTFADVRDDMRIAREEIFGPVISALPFDDVEEVIRRANATNYGLAGGIWTNDVRKIQKVSKALRAGTIYVNTYALMDSAMPFGGYKMSGYGRESGREHYDAYLETKSVYINYG